MARFQASGASTDESSSSPSGHTKQPLHSTFSSGPAIQTKKPVLESLSGSAIHVPPKPSFLKNTVSTKSDTEVHEANKTKALASRFNTKQDDNNVHNKPFNQNRVHTLKPLSQAPEATGPAQKPLLRNDSLKFTLSDSKPALPKPSLTGCPKPRWVKEDSGGGAPSITGAPPPKIPPLQQKPRSSFVKLRQQNEEIAGANTDTTKLTSSPTDRKPPSNFMSAQNIFKEKDKTEQTESSVKADNKPALTATNSSPPPKPPASKKPSFRSQSKPPLQTGGVNGEATSGPKRNALPNIFALGAAPAKPNRPPNVSLENFRRGAEASNGKLKLE